MTMFATHLIAPTSSVDSALRCHSTHMLDPSMVCLALVRNVHFSGPEKFRTFPIGCLQATKTSACAVSAFLSIQIMDMSPPVCNSCKWHSVAADVHIHVDAARNGR